MFLSRTSLTKKQFYGVIIPASLMLFCILFSFVVSFVILDSIHHQFSQPKNIHNKLNLNTNTKQTLNLNLKSKQAVTVINGNETLKLRLSDHEIQGIYNKYILPKEESQTYLQKYAWLSNGTFWPSRHSKEYWATGGGHLDLTRLYETASFEEYVVKYGLNLSCHSILSVNSETDHEMQYIRNNCSTLKDLKYTGTASEGDLYYLDLEFKQYSFVMLPQTLEHVYQPNMILKKVFEHMASGAYLYLSVPAQNIPHMMPIYFMDYKPIALGCLARQAGFSILEIDFWGSPIYIHRLWTKKYWSIYPQFLEYEPIINEPFYTVQTWGLFRKP